MGHNRLVPMSRNTSHRQKLIGLIVALAVIAIACTDTATSAEGGSSNSAAAWGSEAIVYVDRLAEVYRENDFYGILDFYTAAAEIEKWRGDNRGGWPVPDLIKWNSADLGFDVVGVHLGVDGALTIVRWLSSDDVGVVISDFNDGRIDHEVAFDLGDSLERSLRATPETIRTYEGLYRAYADAWSGHDGAAAARLYAPGAVIRDIGRAGPGVIVEDGIASSRDAWEIITASDLFEDQSEAVPALFLGPSEYGGDPGRAVGVYLVTNAEGCQYQTGVGWILEDGVIVDEIRFHEAESYRRCVSDTLPVGWWSDLALPNPSDQVATGEIRSVDGSRIEIRNGTEALVDLLGWGIARFADGDLSPPAMDAVIFEPSRNCEDRSGRVLDDGTVRNLFVCMYDSDVCTIAGSCTVPGTSARIAMLHELAHAWMIDHVDDETVQELLVVSGRTTWDDQTVPWIKRGVEYAADVVAWGLLEESLPMVRLGAPPCVELARAFSVITGSSPPNRCT